MIYLYMYKVSAFKGKNIFPSLLFQTYLKGSSWKERRGSVKLVDWTKWNFLGNPKQYRGCCTNTPAAPPFPSLRSRAHTPLLNISEGQLKRQTTSTFHALQNFYAQFWCSSVPGTSMLGKICLSQPKEPMLTTF